MTDEAARIVERARRVLRTESEGILGIAGRLDESFVRAVELLRARRGKVVVTGVGKSGLVCRKIAATLASTGTPAFFVHSGDGVHGDLGMITKDDIVLAVSNSGETPEILMLLPHFRRFGLKMIAMTGKPDSTLAKAADVVLNVGVREEACPLGLAPTASTTAALAMGDALAVVLLELNGFNEEDFALRHPGGILGRKLLLRVGDLMHRGEELPLVREDTEMKEALFEITSKRLGVTGVVDGGGKLVGVITDGDLRRGLQKHDRIFELKAADLMTRSPKTIVRDALAAEAVEIMEKYMITSLFVLEEGNRKPAGLIHLHDLVKAGIANAP
ncbi:MAG TPA: KpsF/GutQ family sugar-phosphate isomerase [candidate division Zixibacteria bacterium]|nr:KpsF/GutQ family sugar-phosphate isomerase [candidate division Zixibacteria bacterium]